MPDHLALTQGLRCLCDDPASSDEFFVLPSCLLPPSLFCRQFVVPTLPFCLRFLYRQHQRFDSSHNLAQRFVDLLFPFSLGPCVAYGSCFITEQRDPQESRRLVVALRRRPAPIAFSP